MTNLELVLNMLGRRRPLKFPRNANRKRFRKIGKWREGGSVAGNARKEIEQKTGKRVISGLNFKGIEGQKKLSERKKRN